MLLHSIFHRIYSVDFLVLINFVIVLANLSGKSKTFPSHYLNFIVLIGRMIAYIYNINTTIHRVEMQK